MVVMVMNRPLVPHREIRSPLIRPGSLPGRDRSILLLRVPETAQERSGSVWTGVRTFFAA